MSKRIVALLITGVVGVGGAAAPAMAAKTSTSSAKWTSSKCQTYKSTFLKAHKKPTSKQIAAANKVLKAHGCTIKA